MSLLYLLLITLANFLACSTSTIEVSDVINISWNNRQNVTDFVIQSSLGQGVLTSNAWLGFGFGNNMVCRLKLYKNYFIS